MYTSEFLEQVRNFARTVDGKPCNKCKLSVPIPNSVLVFDYINSGATDWTLLPALSVNRHLEPVADEQGVVICDGSPSRWQCILGVKDERPEYTTNDDQNPTALAIWELMKMLGSPELK
jgi:hypothetical protein